MPELPSTGVTKIRKALEFDETPIQGKLNHIYPRLCAYCHVFSIFICCLYVGTYSQPVYKNRKLSNAYSRHCFAYITNMKNMGVNPGGDGRDASPQFLECGGRISNYPPPPTFSHV